MPTRSRPGPRRVRAVLAERADAHGDQAVVEIGRRDVPALERPGPEVLDDDVRGRGEPAEQVLALGRAQVERDALAAAALDGPEQRVRRPIVAVARDERPDLAHEVAACRAARS